ncbi:hypothetical protein PanWU01x14_012300 [Parasponia andersonii]|uniref:PLATZ transcription factor family protein n=1 Tax=Parasponia andersonii TaxID=3476 RepID=A0A2P5E1T1_PARAD|nr:hypothetical protein PanWU01x14_012300 [Parasponia andersonii]
MAKHHQNQRMNFRNHGIFDFFLAEDRLLGCGTYGGAFPYKCNKRLVIALNPLPHSGTTCIEASCKICKRRLAEPDLYCYCSIACKASDELEEASGLDGSARPRAKTGPSPERVETECVIVDYMFY